MDSSAKRVQKWRAKNARQGGCTLSICLDAETAAMFKDLREKLPLKNAEIISRAVKMLHGAICGTVPKAPAAAKPKKPGAALFKEINERYVKEKTPVAAMKTDLAKAFRLMLKEDYDLYFIQKRLNDYGLPTISGKKKWTLDEIRKLIRFG